MFKKKEELEKAIVDWKNEAFGNHRICNDTIVVYAIYFNKLIIYTDKPGLLVGKGGVYFHNFENKLKELKIHKKVDIVELRKYGTKSIRRLSPLEVMFKKIKKYFRRDS